MADVQGEGVTTSDNAGQGGGGGGGGSENPSFGRTSFVSGPLRITYISLKTNYLYTIV
jgi:hypothetical protein